MFLFLQERRHAAVSWIDDERRFESENLLEGFVDPVRFGGDHVMASDGTLEESVAGEEGIVVLEEIADASSSMEGSMDHLNLKIPKR